MALPSDGEWWERARDRWLAWLGQKPGRLKAMVAVNLLTACIVVVAAAAVDGFGRGVHVWLPCAFMLLGWLAFAPTKTVRWASVFRLFSLSALWALVVAAISLKMSGGIGLAASDPGPSIGIAAMMEETLKLAPLAVLGVLAPGRIRRFAAVDWILMGLACGMGFQASEDFIRQATLRPSIFSLGQSWRYGWTLFGGRFDVGDVASYAGHHIETALVAAGIGLAVRVGTRKPWRWLWALPPGLWLVVVCDHAGFNATLADRSAFTSGRSTVPRFVHSVWEWTGHGFSRGWLLLGLFVVATLADARVQAPDAARRASGLPEDPASGAAITGLARSAVLVSASIQSLISIVSRTVGAANAGWHRSTAPGRVRAVTMVAHLAAERRRREVEGAPFRPKQPLLPTRVVVGLAGTLGVALNVLLARSLAERIGRTLRAPRGIWFAGLLEGLARWWDGLGPGGQGLVVAGGAALLVLGGFLLLPELVAGGLVVTEGGLIVVGGATGTSSVGVPAIIAGSGVLTMAAAGSAASAGGADDGDDSTADPEQARFNELARDPARGGTIDDKSIQEARVAQNLERSGRLSGLRRDPTGGADFIDSANQAWDVKGFNSAYDNGYELKSARDLIAKSLRDKENVIIDTTKMTQAHIHELRVAVEGEAAWAGKILWWP